MSAIFMPAIDPRNPIRLINLDTLGAMCGTFPDHEAAEQRLRELGYGSDEYRRDGDTVLFCGGTNC